MTFLKDSRGQLEHMTDQYDAAWDAVNALAPDVLQPALTELCFAVDELIEARVQRARDRDGVARVEDDLRLLDFLKRLDVG